MGFFDSGIGQIVGAGLSVIPGVGSFIGQQSANEANRDIASQGNAMSQANAREQMAFQERMANTSHAREVQDLKNAGLNPILSVNAGAASPGGAAGAVSNATMQNTMAGGAASAMEMVGVIQQYRKQKKELELMEEQKKLTKSQRGKTDIEAKVKAGEIPISDMKTKAYDAMLPYVNKINEGMKSQPDRIKLPNGKTIRGIGDYNDRNLETIPIRGPR